MCHLICVGGTESEACGCECGCVGWSYFRLGGDNACVCMCVYARMCGHTWSVWERRGDKLFIW